MQQTHVPLLRVDRTDGDCGMTKERKRRETPHSQARRRWGNAGLQSTPAAGKKKKGSGGKRRTPNRACR
jgi:hypothetical protein